MTFCSCGSLAMSRSSVSSTLPMPNATIFVGTPADVTLLNRSASFCNRIIIFIYGGRQSVGVHAVWTRLAKSTYMWTPPVLVSVESRKLLQDATLSQGEPRDTAISFDTTASCMRLLWHSMGFLYRPTSPTVQMPKLHHTVL